MSRVEARESVFRLIYMTIMIKEHSDSNFYSEERTRLYFDSEKIDLLHRDLVYIKDILVGLDKTESTIRKIIESKLIAWSVERISKVLYSILLLSIYEILHRDDIPNQVSANEAVNLAKLYDTPEGASLINGILGKLISELDNNNKNNKTDDTNIE